MESRSCTKCLRALPIAEFRFDNVARQVRKTRRRECENRRMREDRAKFREARREGDRRRYRNRPEHQHTRTIMRRYGLTDAQAAAVVSETACDLCGKDNGTKRMVVDHCHATGRNRGVLCDKCNLALGNLGDDPALVRRLLAYLERGGSGRFG